MQILATCRSIALTVAGWVIAGLAAHAQAAGPEPQSAPAVRFSAAHGFYTNAFKLVLEAKPPGEIHFTLNGGTPRAASPVYQAPIEIDKTTIIRAVAIAGDGTAGPSETRTYIFPEDVIHQSPNGAPPPGWPGSGHFRMHYGMDPRIIDNAKLRTEAIPGLLSLPSFSVVADPDDLFGRRGLYSHPSAEGRGAERPVSIELILPDGKAGFQANCGARIRGGVSSQPYNPKHGLRFFFRKEYGPGHLEYPVFGPDGPKSFDCFDLRCEQNHSWHFENASECLFIRDQFARDLQLAMGEPAARGDFCHLYINGQYWGLFDTCERPEASFAASHFGGKKQDYDVIKVHGVGGTPGRRFKIEATDGDEQAWKRMHDGASANLANNGAYFALLGCKPDGSPDPKKETLLDPANLVDYMLLVYYAGDYDGPVTKFFNNTEPNNFHVIRRRESRDGFKFFAWDFEHALLDETEDRTGPFPPTGEFYPRFNPQWLFERCQENAEFRLLLADRIQKHFMAGGVLTPDSVRRLFDRRIAEIETALVLESARWGGAAGRGRGGFNLQGIMIGGGMFSRDHDWRPEVRRMRENYLPNRTAIVLEQLKARGWVAALPAPTGQRQPDGSVRLTGGAGEIVYTLDGSDPRKVGGAPSGEVYKEPIKLAPGARLLARIHRGNQWSPLTDLPH